MQTDDAAATVVVTDATVLINFVHTARLEMLGRLLDYRFVVPDQVAAEIIDPGQRIKLDSAVAAGWLQITTLTAIAGLTIYAELHRFLGAGESACLALAETNGWWVASDERGRFHREVHVRLGRGRLLTTPTIYGLAIQRGHLTVSEADADKAVLAGKRFVMPFQSFGEFTFPSLG